MGKVIGLSGYAQSGKSTVSSMLQQMVPGAVVINFADCIRDLTRTINPYIEDGSGNYLRWNDVEDVIGYERVKAETSGREFLISLGQGARDTVWHDVWVDAWRIKALQSDAPLVIAEDARYLNEARAVTDLHGQVWYIERPGVQAVHETEERAIQEVLQSGLVRREIPNSHTPGWLEEHVDDALYRYV